jgi:transposase
MVGQRLSEEELRLAKKWYLEDNHSPKEIAERLGRDKSTMARLLVKRLAHKPPGRKRLLSEAARDRIETKVKVLVKEADGKHEVTIDRLKRSCRVNSSTRTIARALHERNIYFRKLCEKPVLTDDEKR